jgi:hypothetical protein
MQSPPRKLAHAHTLVAKNSWVYPVTPEATGVKEGNMGNTI